MAAICEGRFNPDAPRSQYWPTAVPAARTPRPADFQEAGVVPIMPRVNIEHQTLADPVATVAEAPEETGPVKEEEGWELTGKRLVGPSDEVIDISSSSESESSVSEVSLSSDEEEQADIPAQKRIKWQSKPSLGERWFQHPSSRIIHAAPVDEAYQTLVSACGNTMKAPFKEIDEVTEWAFKCRVCFAGRCQPTVIA